MDINQQKRFRQVFNELQENMKQLKKKQIQLGWQHRNELITHVYSNYENEEALLSKKDEWEKAGEKYRATEWIFKQLQQNRSFFCVTFYILIGIDLN